MGFVQPDVHVLRTVDTLFAALAILGTAARLFHRHRIHKLWWDDLWAVVSMCAQFVLIGGLWTRTDVAGVGPIVEPHHVRIAAYWMVTLAFTCTLWAARMSMLYSIVRITPTIVSAARYTRWLVAFFAAMWAALLLQKTILCATDRAWYAAPAPQCHLGHRVAILELTTDFVADTILLVLPIRLITSVSTPFAQRRLLLCVFSASVLTTLTSVVHACYLLTVSGLVEGLTANVEASVALVVANLAVIATWIYNRIAPPAADSNIVCDPVPGSGGTRARRTGRGGAVSSIHFAARAASGQHTLVLDTLYTPEEAEADGLKAPSADSHAYPSGATKTYAV